MLQQLLTEIKPIILALILPVLATGLYQIAAVGINWIRERFSPGIQKVKRNWPTLDFAMRMANPELRQKMLASPLSPYVVELFSEESDISPTQVEAATQYALNKFNLDTHEHFSTDAAGPEQQALAGRIVERLEAKFAS